MKKIIITLMALIIVLPVCGAWTSGQPNKENRPRSTRVSYAPMGPEKSKSSQSNLLTERINPQAPNEQKAPIEQKKPDSSYQNPSTLKKLQTLVGLKKAETGKEEISYQNFGTEKEVIEYQNFGKSPEIIEYQNIGASDVGASAEESDSDEEEIAYQNAPRERSQSGDIEVINGTVFPIVINLQGKESIVSNVTLKPKRSFKRVFPASERPILLSVKTTDPKSRPFISDTINSNIQTVTVSLKLIKQ